MSYIIEVTVKNQKGHYAAGHKVGDKIVFDGKGIKGDICYSALMAALPKICAMLNGIHFSWIEDKDIIFSACPAFWFSTRCARQRICQDGL